MDRRISEVLIIILFLFGVAFGLQRILNFTSPGAQKVGALKVADASTSLPAIASQPDNTPSKVEDANRFAAPQDILGPTPPTDSTKLIHVVILMYHHIGEAPPNADGTRRSLTVTTSDFEQQLSWLKDQGYNPVTLGDILVASQGGAKLPEKSVAISFDDGYSDVFNNAVPLLIKYGFKGSFGIITGFVGSSPDYATWDELKAAQKSGMEIVSHTFNHFDAHDGRLTPEIITQNLTWSQTDLKSHLGLDTKILIYPYGHYTAQEIAIAKSLGYEMGLTVRYGEAINPDDLFETPRVRVSGGETLDRFIEYITGKFKDPLPLVIK